jgi:lysylphosphatidylglycerol synthetase-like protein (DUF2156 family)
MLKLAQIKFMSRSHLFLMHLKFFNYRRMMLLFTFFIGSLCLHRAFILPGSALSCSKSISSSAITILIICMGRLFLKILALPPLLQKLLELQIGLGAYFFETSLCFRFSLSFLNQLLVYDLWCL